MIHTPNVTDVAGMFSVLIAVVSILHQVQSVQFISYDMRLLQNNIQSVSTSIQLLRHSVHRLNVDVVLLQEVWHPAEDIFNIWQYTEPIVMLHQGSEGGGVAIVTHRKVKVVHLLQYEVDGLEAVWADVMLGKVRAVVGSVYVPPGDINAINILDTYWKNFAVCLQVVDRNGC